MVSRVVSGQSPVGLGARARWVREGLVRDSGGEMCSGLLMVFGVRGVLSVCLLQRLVCQWAQRLVRGVE